MTMDIIEKPIVKNVIELCCECAAFCHEDKGNRPFCKMKQKFLLSAFTQACDKPQYPADLRKKKYQRKKK